jgi:hypothetical protein
VLLALAMILKDHVVRNQRDHHSALINQYVKELAGVEVRISPGAKRSHYVKNSRRVAIQIPAKNLQYQAYRAERAIHLVKRATNVSQEARNLLVESAQKRLSMKRNGSEEAIPKNQTRVTARGVGSIALSLLNATAVVAREEAKLADAIIPVSRMADTTVLDKKVLELFKTV